MRYHSGSIFVNMHADQKPDRTAEFPDIIPKKRVAEENFIPVKNLNLFRAYKGLGTTGLNRDFLFNIN